MSIVIIRADASADIGGGHIYRCLTLAAELAKQVTAIHFICREENGHLGELIKQNGFALTLLPANTPFEQQTDAIACRKICYQLNSSISLIIVDHYQISTTWEALLSPLTHSFVVIDDLANRPHQCDLLFDQSQGRTADDYSRWLTSRCQHIITGAEHALLRPQFMALREEATLKRSKLNTVQSVLISMGAMDPDNVTHSVLTQLATLKPAANWTINIVLTDQAKHLDSIKMLVDSSPLNMQLHVNVNNMAALILANDIAIAAAGTSMLERCCLGLPGVLVCIADNQQHIAQAVKQSQSAIAVLDANQLVDELAPAINRFINDISRYQQIADKAFAMCNGNGCELLGKRLHQLQAEPQLYLQAVSNADKDRLLEWQSAPKTRQYSRNTEPPTPAQHQKWFDSVMANPEIYFYLLKRGEQACGFVRLDIKTLNIKQKNIHGFEVSIALAPDCYGQGLGHQALLLIQQAYSDQPLLAYIDPQNQASVKAFAKAGFLPLNNLWYLLAAKSKRGK